MHQPDKWIILKILMNNNEWIYKVLAGWDGSYTEGKSWRINSGITKIDTEDHFLLFSGYSGSVYKCHKKAYGTNSMSAEILAGILKNPEMQGRIEVLKEEDAHNLTVG